MKNLAIVAAVVVLAAIAYLLFSKNNQQSADDGVVSGVIEHSQEQAEQAGSAAATTAQSLISASPDGADVFIMEPGDGTTVSSPLTIKFGITNMTVAPAGDNTENSGHHHLLIDVEEMPDMTAPLPATDTIIHFGAGQTETTVELAPGEHTLQLVLGNYLHIPHDPPVISKKITVTVE
ncbi:MAG: DUF4399 domain-containing protein [Pseudomonadota bacterium]